MTRHIDIPSNVAEGKKRALVIRKAVDRNLEELKSTLRDVGVRKVKRS